MNEFSYLNSLPSALIAVDHAMEVRLLNPAAEALLGISAQQAVGHSLGALPGMTAELCGLCERVLAGGEAISMIDYTLLLPFNHRKVTMHLTPVMEGAQVAQVLLAVEKSEGLDRLAASEWKQDVMRAAGVMADMLAHEVKNPLAGIRGAAQLLKDEVPPEHQPLAELICRESDRISDLLSQVDMFAAVAPERMQPVNIHEVLQYVISVAGNGFARHVAFKERYDPSLPPVLGQRELLVQLFLNLVKNAAEALAGRPEPTITLHTHYRSGARMRVGRATSSPLPSWA